MIIAICGFLNSGKGTVSDILVNDYGFIKLSFADPLKDAVSAMFGWPRHLLEGDTKESREFRETPCPFWSARFEKSFTPRLALQLMGTEAGRNVFHEDIWTFSVLKRINEHPTKNYVIADNRFPNEMNHIRKHHGFIVRVKRGDEPNYYETALKENTTHIDAQYVLEDRGELMQQKFPEIHISEWAWIGQTFDYILHNNSTLDMLKADVSHMIRVFQGPLD